MATNTSVVCVLVMSLFSLSKDLLYIIIEELDPISLLHFCKSSRYIHGIVTDSSYSTLLYRYELALSGMKDGIASSYSPRARLDLLLGYKKGWLTLNWTAQEDKFCIDTPTIVGVSGRFLYYASERSHAGTYQCSLHIYELRSYRTPPLHKLQYCKFNVPFEIRKVAIDAAQNLLVLAELRLSSYGAIIATLHFLDMWTCQQHPQAQNLHFHFQTDWWGTLHRVSVERVQIYGIMVGISVRRGVEEGEGITELALVNWHTGNGLPEQFTGDLLSFDILSDLSLMVLSHPDEDDEDDSGGSPWEQSSDGLYLYEHGKRSPQINIHHIQDGRGLRFAQVISYDFPESWKAISFLNICPNTSLKPNVAPPTGTFFHFDPSQRATVILVEFPSHSIPAGCSKKVALVMKESFFQPPSPGYKTLSWEEWQDHCTVVHLPDDSEAHAFEVVGRKLVFFQSAGVVNRLHVLDFNDYAAECLRSIAPLSSTWSRNGECATTSKIFKAGATDFIRTSTQVQRITWVNATEDAVVLYNEHEGKTVIRVRTFGDTLQPAAPNVP